MSPSWVKLSSTWKTRTQLSLGTIKTPIGSPCPVNEPTHTMIVLRRRLGYPKMSPYAAYWLCVRAASIAPAGLIPGAPLATESITGLLKGRICFERSIGRTQQRTAVGYLTEDSILHAVRCETCSVNVRATRLTRLFVIL